MNHSDSAGPKRPARIRTMMVEEDEFISSLFCYHLTLDGYQVEVVRDPRNAVKVFKAFRPELVIMELLMQYIDGFHLLDWCSHQPNTQVAVLSRLDNVEDIQRAVDLGAGAYLVKYRTTPDEVVKKINEMMRG